VEQRRAIKCAFASFLTAEAGTIPTQEGELPVGLLSFEMANQAIMDLAIKPDDCRDMIIQLLVTLTELEEDQTAQSILDEYFDQTGSGD
jgi:hypothetical protein